MVEKLLKDLEEGIRVQKAQKNIPKQSDKPAPKLNINIDKEHKVNVTAKEEDVKEISFKFHPRNAERFAYLLIIILLIGFIGYDRAFLHKGIKEIAPDTTASVVKESPKEAPKEAPAAASAATPPPAPAAEVKKEEPKKEPAAAAVAETPKPQLSGIIDISITSIDEEKVSDVLGYVRSVTFSIENGKEGVFFPHVTVIAYDKTTEEAMSDKSRGTYTYPSGIKSGEKQTGSISLMPKSFSDLNLPKTLILFLRDKNAEGKIITTTKSEFTID